MKKVLFFIILFCIGIGAFSQVPILRLPKKVLSDTVAKPDRTREQPPEKKTEIVNIKTKNAAINKPIVKLGSETNFQYRSLLQFFEKQIEPECKGNDCIRNYYSFSKINTIYPNSEFASTTKNWKYECLWKDFPKEALFGRWEISLYPFSTATSNPDFTGVIAEGYIDITNKDSANFFISYTDDLPTPLQRAPIIINNQNKIRSIGTPTRTRSNTNARRTTNIILNKQLFTKMNAALFNKKFYIRILPLDANKNVINNSSNDISVLEKTYTKPKPKPTIPTLYNDYTITSFKYVPVHYPEAAFLNCSIVQNPTGQGLIPNGTVLCPQPAKDKAWYEKAFDGITGFIKMAIDGAAKYYNETKGFLKNKWKEFNCDANGMVAVINPVSKVQELAGPEVCEFISNAAFEYGMAAVGLPPSLPTTDELMELSKGQVVDLAMDKVEEETGIPVPEYAREQLKNELNNQLKTGVNVNGGGVNVKPHPRGQFQTAYIEMEVTRTSANCNNRGSLILNYSDNADAKWEVYNSKTKQKEWIALSSNLFEDTYTAVPFIEKVGDKKKVYIILKPAINYFHSNKETNAIKSIENAPPINVYYTPHSDEYERAANQGEFIVLTKPGQSSLTISIGLKKADGINMLIKN